MEVVKIVEREVADKIDTQYVSAQFQHVDDVCITFLCTLDDQEEDEWINEGTHYITIRLPYDMVKRSADVRDFMVAIVKERLGIAA